MFIAMKKWFNKVFRKNTKTKSSNREQYLFKGMATNIPASEDTIVVDTVNVVIKHNNDVVGVASSLLSTIEKEKDNDNIKIKLYDFNKNVEIVEDGIFQVELSTVGRQNLTNQVTHDVYMILDQAQIHGDEVCVAPYNTARTLFVKRV